jgi:hypothetical protein
MPGRPLEDDAEWAEEVSIAAPDRERLLAAWIGELARRSVRSNVRFEEFDVFYLSDRRLAASIRGRRLGLQLPSDGPSGEPSGRSETGDAAGA